MKHCPNIRLIMVSEWQGKPLYLDVMRVRCKQWSCPYCSVMNGKIWRSHLLTRLNSPEFEGAQWAMITLTADGKDHKKNPEATIRSLQKSWRKMRNRLLRYNGGFFSYVRVFERHTKGKYGGYHLHIIADLGRVYGERKAAFGLVLAREAKARKLGLRPRKRLLKERHPARWIKDACRATGGGYIADFRPLKGGTKQAIRYTTKYVVKQLELGVFPKFMPRIKGSRDVGSPKKKGGGKTRQWRPRAGIFIEDLKAYEKLFDVSTNHVINEDDDFSHGELWYPPEME
jgi:hypothetical protein